MEINSPPCPTHGALPRALHTENFEGIVTVVQEIIETVSGLGTVSYARCPYGYPSNFEGVVRVLEDLNTSISGVQGGGSNIIAGSGITAIPSGDFEIFNVDVLGIGGVEVTYSGSVILISGQASTGVAVVSGLVAGPGINVTVSGGSAVVSQNSQGLGTVNLSFAGSTAVYSGLTNQVLGGSGITVQPSGTASIVNAGVLAGTDIGVTYSGAFVTVASTGAGAGASIVVSGDPGTGYRSGSLWFDTNQGRLFIYASGANVATPSWYQSNSEALVLKGQVPPSGTGLNAPPRDGLLWFNSLLGSLFVYDATSSGWYEAGPSRSFAYSSSAPAPSVEGAGWYDESTSSLKVWDGTAWISV
jgi:hypothetical protein